MTDITTTTNTNTPRQTDTLWTRDFTIITIGSVISMLGNSLTSFAMSLMVLDYTNSSMLYAIYMVLYTLPQLVTPIISGAILDRFSRKKMIYTLDFVSAGIYLIMAITLLNGVFNFPMFAAVIFILGIIQSTYYIAYDSLYPMLITEGYYQKAYSISSMLETMTVVMVPVSTFVYKLVGIGPLMIINAVSFAIAAVFEMQIGHEEKYVEKRKNEVDNSSSKINQMLIDIKEGVKYMRSEPALLAIVSYFGLNMLACGAMDVLCLPYYKQNFKNGEYLYALVFGMSFIGRAVGGGIHYKFKIPTKLKFMFAMTIYIIIAIGEGTYMFMPIGLAVVVCFITGISGVTSYTIRISSTQSYVPDEKKGRYNGAFQLITTIGLLIGQMAGGALAQKMDARFVVFAGNIIALIAAIIIIGGNRKAVAKIYNTDN
ncbi:MFS transporter [Pseudobutyrivibrio ruminis]|uniref:MFS transporter n=1 Tax=Pseudobutyrivibrio ruminis TaxID=46206 RepID=UPI000485E99A|nr:MFS transporter [Pseudobutyrivibrio ruminis]